MEKSGQSAGVVFDAERLTDLARSGADMPKGLCLAEIYLFQSMRHLYSEFRRGRISQGTGKRERVQIMNSYRTARSMQSIWAESLERKKDAESAVNEYRRNPTIENADKAINALYGGVGRKQHVKTDSSPL